MSDPETDFHEAWLGMVQPTEGLVVSVPVLVQCQAMRRLPPAEHHRFLGLCPPLVEGSPKRAIQALDAFLDSVLELRADLFDRGDALPADLQHYVPEGQQTIRPTLALRRQNTEAANATPLDGGQSPAALAGAGYVLLVWDLPDDLDLDTPEATTGPWHYPPAAKFDRLLRHCRVPIGLLTNRRELRLIYAPHGETTGSITFRVGDMASVGGRPILDAFVMLLSATRFFGVATECQLPALLRESRLRQANVTNALAEQVFEALEFLLAGFEAAAERHGADLLRDARERKDDHLYGGLLTVLLRLVFVLYAEARGLLPIERDFYTKHLSVLGLYEQLQRDHGLYPDSMSLRFGAWSRLLTLFRALFLGVEHGDLVLPQRRGDLFDPHRFPFLEGWGPGGSAPITLAEDRGAVRVPTVDDGTIYEVLHRLLFLEGQRLSYSTLDVEQIGSVYEALMGYHVQRVEAPAVCVRPQRVWITASELLAEKQVDGWLQDHVGLARAQAHKLAAELKGLKDEEAVLEILDGHKARNTGRAPAGRLVLQPGAERRRTSSHYTPRSLSEPIVRRTLEPLLAAMKPVPAAKGILDLKVCDPAMGSGAFLVEACRFLADQLVAAWTREGQLEGIAAEHPDVVHYARRLVAQRCLYGVDRNPFAVGLAKLSLWLATLAKDLPFTFLDHALRCGDSLVGLSFEQVCAFDWKPTTKKVDPSAQLELFGKELEQALGEAIGLRQRICDLASDPGYQAQREKERLLQDADDAMDRVRLAADVCVGAFFSADKDKAREAERDRRRGLVERWLRTGDPATPELLGLQEELREQVRPFHWGVEFPEVFYLERPDPLEGGRVNKDAWMDAFLGNPPFLGGKRISTVHGDAYAAWLEVLHGSSKNADLCAHFFRRAASLLGKHGTIGLLATNTIAQGDTRTSGLRVLVRDQGYAIYEAIRSMPWPGEAAVAVAVAHLGRGTPMEATACRRLDGLPVEAINSLLRGKPERDEAVHLSHSSGVCFQGANLVGIGFTLTPHEREDLVSRNASNAQLIHAFVGGEEVNSNPSHEFERYVIDFGDLTLPEARAWPDLLSLVEARVKPARDQSNRAVYRNRWWLFGERQKALYSTLAKPGLRRCLVNSQVSKHLVFAWQPTDRVFAHTLYVSGCDSDALFAVVQSRVHEAWARLLSSSLEDRLRYSVADCFETFPFPTPDPRDLPASIDPPGEALYTARADYMVATHQGLTDTYNRLKDPTCDDPAVVELRRLHEDLDRAVLAAYLEHAGWPEIAIPPYGTPTTPAERHALETFEDEVIDRLFQLNAERAAAEAKAAHKAKPKSKAKSPKAAGTRAKKTTPAQAESELFDA